MRNPLIFLLPVGLLLAACDESAGPRAIHAGPGEATIMEDGTGSVASPQGYAVRVTVAPRVLAFESNDCTGEANASDLNAAEEAAGAVVIDGGQFLAAAPAAARPIDAGSFRLSGSESCITAWPARVEATRLVANDPAVTGWGVAP